MKKLYDVTSKLQIAHTTYDYETVNYQVELDDEDIPFENWEIYDLLRSKLVDMYLTEKQLSDSEYCISTEDSLEYTDLTPYQ